MIASTFYGCLGTDVDYYQTVIPDKGAQASPALFENVSQVENQMYDNEILAFLI